MQEINSLNEEKITKGKQNKLLLVLFVGVMMGALDISIVGPALPSIHDALHLSERAVTWVFTIYILFNLIGISLMAKLSDFFGRRNIYILAIAIFTLGSIIVSFAHDTTFLLIGRSIQGFGSSGIFPVASAVIGDVFPKEKRGRALGMIGMVFGLAFIIGPIIAGVLLTYFDWNVLFLINLPIAVYLFYGAWKYIPKKGIANKTFPDWKGIILMAAILSLLTYGITSLDRNNLLSSILSLESIFYFVLPIILLLILIVFEKQHKEPVIDVKLFSIKQIQLVGIIALGTGILQSMFVFVPSMVVTVFSIPKEQAGFMLIPLVIFTAFGAPISGRMLDKLGSRIVIFCGSFMMFAGISAVSLFITNKPVFYIGGALIGLGLSFLVGSSLRYVLLNEVSAEQRATSQGIVTIFISIGQMIGAAWFGAVSAANNGSTLGYKIAFGNIAFVGFIMVILSIFLKSRKKELSSIKP